MQTLLIAHRGDTINYKQNAMDAFRSAFAHGAYGIELDIHFENNEFLVVHDYLFDRNQKYPTLKDVLNEFANKGRIEIELKVFTYQSLPVLKNLLEQYTRLDYELTSSNLFILPKVRELMGDASLGAIFLPKEFEEWMTEDFLIRKIVETFKNA
jgi:glycerophosphoryl diester phosphodiesterase